MYSTFKSIQSNRFRNEDITSQTATLPKNTLNYLNWILIKVKIKSSSIGHAKFLRTFANEIFVIWFCFIQQNHTMNTPWSHSHRGCLWSTFQLIQPSCSGLNSTKAGEMVRTLLEVWTLGTTFGDCIVNLVSYRGQQSFVYFRKSYNFRTGRKEFIPTQGLTKVTEIKERC